MLKKVWVVLCLFATQYTSAQPYPQNYFRSPLDIPLALSGTFAELRSNHFHSGIDIKTQGVEGKNVYAVAEGYVSRIKISPWGYGHAIYIAHSNGYTSVYGHLKDLVGPLGEYLEERQYARRSFSLDVYLEANELPVKKGQVVALSGNSGGSGGPHLHFEIRKTSNQQPINPLLFGFDVKDNRKPTLLGAYVYELNPHDPTQKPISRKALKLVNLGAGEYFIDDFKASGTIAFGIHTYDKLDLTENKNGVYQVNQYINDTLVYSFKGEKFLFKNTRYINCHIDFELSKTLGRSIHKCYINTVNRLNVYPVRKGKLKIEPGKKYNLKWVISDVHGNQTFLKTVVVGSDIQHEIPKSTLNILQDNYMSKDGVKVYFPKGSLYENEPIAISKRETPKRTDFLHQFKVGEESIGLQKVATFELDVNDSLELPEDKLIGVWLKKGRDVYNEGGSVTNGKIKFTSRRMGHFAVMVDTTAPKISGKLLRKDKTYRNGKDIKFLVSDDLSGVDTYSAFIDGQWVLLKFDPKRNLMWHTLSNKISAGEHEMKVKITDERKNSQFFSFSFTKL